VRDATPEALASFLNKELNSSQFKKSVT